MAKNLATVYRKLVHLPTPCLSGRAIVTDTEPLAPLSVDQCALRRGRHIKSGGLKYSKGPALEGLSTTFQVFIITDLWLPTDSPIWSVHEETI